MAIVAPFRGVRFNPEKVVNLEDVVTPPYDVINEADGKAFLEKNQYNMIQLDLRNDSQSQGAQENRYSDASQLFEQWQGLDVLVRDTEPSIYLYYIDYTHPSGRRMTRKGLVSLVGLAEFSEGIVKPHEKTFEGVIADRLELMDTCKAQFSKVFSIYSDKENEIINCLESKRESTPLCTTKDHFNNIHTLWRVTDPEVLERVRKLFEDKPVYIADGHHRYTTALGCRKRALARNPELPASSPFNHIMMYLCPAEDEGLSVLPTHRLVKYPGGLSVDALLEKLGAGFTVEEMKGGAREVLIAEVLSRMDEESMSGSDPVFGVYHPGEDRCFLLHVKKDALQRSGVSGKPEVLQELDVVVLSEFIIHELLGLDHHRCLHEKLVRYYSDPDEAIDVAVKDSVEDDSASPLLFLLNHTRVDQVMKVADSGEIMPHKSTYFYPKIMTGLLINKLVDGEAVC